MNAMQVFTYEAHEVRVVGTPERPEWVLSDVCAVLGIKNSRQALKRIPAKWRGDGVILNDAMGRPQQHATIKEPALYWLVNRSDKKEAQPFAEWVCEEVLPSIRRKGHYAAPGAALVSLDQLRQALAEQRRDLLAQVHPIVLVLQRGEREKASAAGEGLNAWRLLKDHLAALEGATDPQRLIFEETRPDATAALVAIEKRLAALEARS